MGLVQMAHCRKIGSGDVLLESQSQLTKFGFLKGQLCCGNTELLLYLEPPFGDANGVGAGALQKVKQRQTVVKKLNRNQQESVLRKCQLLGSGDVELHLHLEPRFGPRILQTDLTVGKTLKPRQSNHQSSVFQEQSACALFAPGSFPRV